MNTGRKSAWSCCGADRHSTVKFCKPLPHLTMWMQSLKYWPFQSFADTLKRCENGGNWPQTRALSQQQWIFAGGLSSGFRVLTTNVHRLVSNRQIAVRCPQLKSRRAIQRLRRSLRHGPMAATYTMLAAGNPPTGRCTKRRRCWCSFRTICHAHAGGKHFGFQSSSI